MASHGKIGSDNYSQQVRLTGVIAGGAVRTVLELAGVKNILAKQLGSGNPLNNARAAVNALKTLRSFNQVAEDRGVTVADLFA